MSEQFKYFSRLGFFAFDADIVLEPDTTGTLIMRCFLITSESMKTAHQKIKAVDSMLCESYSKGDWRLDASGKVQIKPLGVLNLEQILDEDGEIIEIFDETLLDISFLCASEEVMSDEELQNEIGMETGGKGDPRIKNIWSE